MAPPTRSNRAVLALAVLRLGRACRTLTRSRDGSDRLQTLLKLALDACDAERAFLAVATADAGEGFRLTAHSSTRSDGERQPSRTALCHALAGSGPSVVTDVRGHRPLDEPSVRSLRLRSILSAPVPTGTTTRAALILDSRAGARLPARELRVLLNAFASLVALALRSTPSSLASTESASPTSATYRSMLDWVRRIAATNLPVLVVGESGTGKERISRTLHRLSPRSAGPFVAINCTALTESLLEAELFGSVRGAYTGSDRDRPGLFRTAHGGTLLLDEVGDMPRPMQAKLLRALEESRVRPVGGGAEIPVDVRIVAASQHDLARRVAVGRFRPDLYYRLAVLQVDVPPLRERREDLPRLVEELAPRLAAETGLDPPRLTPAAWQWLRAQTWPGNVRELHAVLARATLRADGAEITPRDLDPPAAPAPGPVEADLEPPLEHDMIRSAIRASEGNLAGAAARIGWTRQKLYRRMKVLGLR